MKSSESIIVKAGDNKKLLIGIIIILLVIIIFSYTGKKVKTKVSVKSSLEKVVEKSDLETVNFTYNVIAKKCRDDNDCDLTSNNIDDFKYVVSCEGIITAGIDFNDVKIEIDDINKTIIVTIPEAKLTGEPGVQPPKFLNDEDLHGELPNAMKLCVETIKNKSNEDGKLLVAAKDQARVVLESFYSKWIKAYNPKYVVEVR